MNLLLRFHRPDWERAFLASQARSHFRLDMVGFAFMMLFWSLIVRMPDVPNHRGMWALLAMAMASPLAALLRPAWAEW